MQFTAAATARGQGDCNVRDGHGRRAGLFRHLGRGVGDMDEPAADGREFLLYVVEDAVHHVVADISSGGVGKHRRITGLLDGLYHGFHRKIREISRISIGKNRLVDGLVPFVVWDSGIGDVDGNTFRGHAEPAACLADTDDDVGLFGYHFFMDLFNGFADDSRDLHLDDLSACDLIGQELYGFPGRVDGLAAERIEACN